MHYPFVRPVSTARAYECCFRQPSVQTVQTAVKNSARSQGPYRFLVQSQNSKQCLFLKYYALDDVIYDAAHRGMGRQRQKKVALLATTAILPSASGQTSQKITVLLGEKLAS